jgi:hypothetical protein
MTKEELISILETGLEANEIQELYIDELVRQPGAKGCIKLNNNWFLYGKQDERGHISFTGPFNDKAIVYAIAVTFSKSSLFQKYKFTPKEMDIFCDNVFSSLDEIRNI